MLLCSSFEGQIINIDLAFKRTTQKHIVRIVSETVQGQLRQEIELFVQNAAEVVLPLIPGPGEYPVGRDNVSWESIRKYVIENFLPPNYQQRLRDEVKIFTRSPLQTIPQFNMVFSQLANQAYPHPRTDEQERRLYMAYLRGVNNQEYLTRALHAGKAQTLQEMMKLVSSYVVMTDQIARCTNVQLKSSINERAETPVQTNAVTQQIKEVAGSSKNSSQQLDAELGRVIIKGIENLNTNVVQLAHTAALQNQQDTQQGQDGGYSNGANSYSNSQSQRSKPHNNSAGVTSGQATRRHFGSQHSGEDPQWSTMPKWNKRGQPRCFECNVYGHMARDCNSLNQGNE